VRLVGSVDELDMHLQDAQAVVPFIPASAQRLVDVGSGGGFPSVVIAIARPELTVVALEPVHKKHAFLSAVRRELALDNFQPRAERDEQHRARPDFAPYDVAISRATFHLPEWLERGRALVHPGGVVLGMEGRQRHELPHGAVRHELAVEGRSHALVVLPIR
jgi:16S rRNA (guanine527-N7)-methyltransferase